MPRAKISEFSTTAGDNTDIDGINIGEGCAPSGINDAIRELMAQLKDFQSGAAGDNITVVGTLAAKGTSSSGADLKLYEDTDNGTNYVGFIAPASIASNVQWTLPSADGSSGQALQTNGSGTLSFATLGISAGGTGQTTANAAFNALAPSQTSNAGRYLKTDGTNTSWDLLDISTADITGTLPVANGGTGITSFGTGVATALGINVGSSGAFVTNGGALGTPSSGTVTNLTGTASININGTVGATTPNTGSFTTLTTSSTVTINGGTANGVAYLNASKVLTTGSALTFDGTNLGVGVTSVGAKIQAETNASSGDTAVVAVSKTGLGYTTTLGYYASAGTATAGVVRSANNLPLAFETNNAEGMRLTSTGLGIGTSSPATKLDVNGDITQRNGSGITIGKIENASGWYSLTGDSANVNGAQMSHSTTLRFVTASTERMRLDSSGNLGIGTSSPAYKLEVNGVAGVNTSDANAAEFHIKNTSASARDWILLSTGSSWAGGGQTGYFNIYDNTAGQQRLTIDSSGNLGLGVTPSAWSSSMRVLQVASTALYNNGFNDTFLGANFYNDTVGTNRYINSDFAAAYGQVGGAHQWYTAASGTAGNAISFTQAATLDADGNFMVGVTSSSFRMSAVVASGANRDIFGAQISGVSNGFTIKWNHATTTTRVNIANLPTSSAGLASGDLWNDGGTLKVA
jgi:hypothetical protein